ncbi:MAG: hypothetical protein VKJ46_04470 [Leptolyngbyaceae bacterium]|nr:hypothetical protein [Leptolyngbyaceae bacterium]
MKRKSFHFALPLALLLTSSFAYGQDSHGPGPKKPRTVDDYTPRTLKEIATQGTNEENRGNKEETMLLYGDILPSRVRVKYTGLTRQFPPNKQEVLRQWAQLYAGFPEGYTEPYKMEMLFIEDGTNHWLAVRKKSLPLMKQGLKAGETVDLHFIRVGATRDSNRWELVLLVENFQKLN